MTDYFEGINDKKRFLQPVLTSERKKEKQVRIGYTGRDRYRLYRHRDRRIQTDIIIRFHDDAACRRQPLVTPLWFGGSWWDKLLSPGTRRHTSACTLQAVKTQQAYFKGLAFSK